MRRAIVLGIALVALAWCADWSSEVWKFDSITQIGGHKVTAEGHPRVIATPAGKAVEFGGVEDALFLDVHPLAGAETFTWEVIFRPDVGGAAEQRFFHVWQMGLEELAQPGQLGVVLAVGLGAFLVAPMGGDADLGHLVHRLGPDLDLERLAVEGDHGRMERLV